jgi:hypothetical protein
MQGSKRLRYLTITENGLKPEELPHMYQLPSTISELIRDEREMASVRFYNACVAKAFDVAAKWEATVEYWDAINDRAVRYKQGLAEDLSRPKPRLITDKSMTEATGIHHITLRSLDHWARITYGEGTLDQDQQNLAANLPASPNTARVKGLQKESAIIETIKRLGFNPEQFPPNPPGKAGVKSEVRNILLKQRTLFTSLGSFEKSWAALRSEKRIVDCGCPPK